MIRRELRALAKINIDLRVLHKREDGFHELRTIFQTIDLEDRIRVFCEPSSATHIEIDGNIQIEDNLIARAARLVLQETGVTAQLHFMLEKQIPMGAGLGGGSSDAAAVLFALPQLIRSAIAPERLHELAASLGSDVPFFLYGGAALGIGRGEELYPLPDLPHLQGLLIAPDIHVSTAEAYRLLSARLNPESAPARRASFGQLAWTEDLAQARNDFEVPVFERYPELAAIRQSLESCGAVCARMTGSGSSLFGLFRRKEEASRAEASFSNYRTQLFSLVTRDQYRALRT